MSFRSASVVVTLGFAFLFYGCDGAAARPTQLSGEGEAQQPAPSVPAGGAEFQPSPLAGLIAPGAQATAFLVNVSPEDRALAPALIYSGQIQNGLLMTKTVLSRPREFRSELSTNMWKYVTARPVGPAGCSALAIDARGCQSEQLAEELARAAAEIYRKHLAEEQRFKIETKITPLAKQRDMLKGRVRAVRDDIQMMMTKGPMAAMTERHNLVSIALEGLAREVLAADVAQAQAAAALKAHQEQLKNGTGAKDPQVRRHLEADPALRDLNARVVEATLQMDLAQHKSGPKHADVQQLGGKIQSLQRQRSERQSELVRASVESIGQQRQMTYAAATQRLADVKDRLAIAKSEAADLEDTVGRIASLKAEEKRMGHLLDRIEQQHQQLELKVVGMRPGGPCYLPGAPVLLGVVRTRSAGVHQSASGRLLRQLAD